MDDIMSSTLYRRTARSEKNKWCCGQGSAWNFAKLVGMFLRRSLLAL